MNLNKARDFYSAYYEQSLDSGLSQAFERAMAQDAQVSAEYRQFVRIMDELKAFEAPVQVPSDLHAKIRERVDAHIISLEHKSKTPSWFFGWKPIAYGAVASVAIIAALVSISNQGGGRKVGTADFVGVRDASPKLTLDKGVVTLQFAAAKSGNVSVTDIATGEVLYSAHLMGQQLVAPIANSSTEAKVVSIKFGTAYEPLLLAMPGTSFGSETDGTGTLTEMAKALAARYSTPVVVQSNAPVGTVDWQFEGTDALNAAKDELDKLGLKAEVLSGGLVWISSN